MSAPSFSSRNHGPAKAAPLIKRVLKKVLPVRLIKRVLRVGVNTRLAGLYFHSQNVRKLQIGSGDHPLPGWLNTDLSPSSRNVFQLDVTRRFPFADNSFDYLFCEHMVEHIAYPEGLYALSECFRVLKPGGVIRIATPDLRFLIELFRNDLSKVQRQYIEWATTNFASNAPYPADVFVLNSFVREWGHQFIYDKSLLRHSMERAGFRELTTCEPGLSRQPDLRGLENQDRMPDGFYTLETVIIEGTKP